MGGWRRPGTRGSPPWWRCSTSAPPAPAASRACSRLSHRGHGGGGDGGQGQRGVKPGPGAECREEGAAQPMPRACCMRPQQPPPQRPRRHHQRSRRRGGARTRERRGQLVGERDLVQAHAHAGAAPVGVAGDVCVERVKRCIVGLGLEARHDAGGHVPGRGATRRGGREAVGGGGGEAGSDGRPAPAALTDAPPERRSRCWRPPPRLIHKCTSTHPATQSTLRSLAHAPPSSPQAAHPPTHAHLSSRMATSWKGSSAEATSRSVAPGHSAATAPSELSGVGSSLGLAARTSIAVRDRRTAEGTWWERGGRAVRGGGRGVAV